jgi:hypothetical protein
MGLIPAAVYQNPARRFSAATFLDSLNLDIFCSIQVVVYMVGAIGNLV